MKRPIDLSLYLVTNRGSLQLDDYFSIIRASVNGGVKIVQLREKTTPIHETIAIGKKLLSFLKPMRIPLIINDSVDVAFAIGADGVHLGQSDLCVSEARTILGKNAIIGLSVELLEQAKIANEQEVDYLAAGPIFPTKTKTNCGEPWGLKNLKHFCTISNHPVIGIGGINITNVKQVIECGAIGAAVVSAIFNADCPKTAAQEMINRMKL